jgi:hypothetical protein
MSTKISQLTSATDITASDLMQIVDVEDGVMAPSGTNKKVTASLLAKELAKQPLEPGIVISGSSSGDAVRITQTGSGNAIVVEDSTNPDATPFVVNDQGQLLIGNSTSLVGPFAYSRGLQLTNQGAQFNAFTSNQFGEGIAFVKTRGTPSSPHTIVQLNDALGSVSFSGSDGSGYVLGSQIASFVDQVPGANDMPTCLTFATTPDGSATCTERMRITSAGNVGIGTVTPAADAPLHIRSVAGGVKRVFLQNIATTGGTQSRYDLATGTADAYSIMSLTESGTGNVTFSLDAGPGVNNGMFFSSGTTSAPIVFRQSTTERMRITSAGDVGIGTVTPSSKLHVAGDLTVSSATTATSATAGTNGDVPAQVAGYLVVNINGFPFKIPYYPA